MSEQLKYHKLLGLVLVIISISILAVPVFASQQAVPADAAVLRSWIQEMKKSPKGPFSRIRWFCTDGTVQPPTPYACSEHGGGVQHGEWSERTRMLRAQGYYIANVLADIKEDDLNSNTESLDRLKQILLEQFLIAADDGWIFRRARYYRGALQAEDEMRGAQRLLVSLLSYRDWRGNSFLLLREAVRLLPQKKEITLITRVRQLSTAIGEKDENFELLRTKIHTKPDASDADRIRAYAEISGLPDLAQDYENLAEAIDRLYRSRDIGEELRSLADRVKDPELKNVLRNGSYRLSAQDDLATQFATTSQLLASLRDYYDRAADYNLALSVLETSVALEQDVFTNGRALLKGLPQASRRERLRWLENTTAALYGAGLISARQRDALNQTFTILAVAETSLTTYKYELDYLARVPGWANQWLLFHFSTTLDHMEVIEPLAHRYLYDRLRGSPLLFYSEVLDSLIIDANNLLSIRHVLFGETVGTGLRALNPGLARGYLKFPGEKDSEISFDRDSIYVLPASTEDLPPIAGILTKAEGSHLSHLQLLARNLGIPNVVVDRRLLPRVNARAGRRVVLGVSPGGVVQLVEDGPYWAELFAQESVPTDIIIRPDLEKLDLETQDFVALDSIRAEDAGRIVGPKAANLGELKYHFPEAVPDGLVIPFGAFRALLDQPMEPGGPTVFRWMQKQYKFIQQMGGDRQAQQQAAAAFLTRLQTWILSADPGTQFRERLRREMTAAFGEDGTYGVFVRSDTNVEDLPGFTGAGLNLTVANVVGFEQVLKAISRVWASPFSERAYGWRQAHMEQPEHVYPAILLQRAVPAEKSGVLVTADVNSERAGWLSVAVNEGVGGVVAGQAAEELRVEVKTGKVRLLTQATEPYRRVLLPEGGTAKIPASGSEALLSSGEIAMLIEFVRMLPEKFPKLRDEDGRPVPADIEFGIHQSRLVLFQIRPYLESQRAQRNLLLAGLDSGLENGRMTRGVLLDAIPPEQP
ncbi:MAG: PEP/pyruvate-binding domain-containing protein [Syntrophobacterales bacterium]